MRKVILGFILSIINTYFLNAQLISPASTYIDGISIGIEKSKSLFIEYGYRGFSSRFKHSVIADKVIYQNFRIEGGYSIQTNFIDLTCDLFYSSEWTFDNYNIGSQVTFISHLFNDYVNFGASYTPYYDNTYKYNNGWAFSGKITITNDISLIAEYGKIPEYRIAYRKIFLGINFIVQNLSVSPILEIPLYNNEPHLSHTQLIFNLCYVFNNNK